MVLQTLLTRHTFSYYKIKRKVNPLSNPSPPPPSSPHTHKHPNTFPWVPIVFSRMLHVSITLGARDFSSAVSGFCQVFIVIRAKRFSRGFGLRPTSKIPAASEKNLWYPGNVSIVKSVKDYIRLLPGDFSTLLITLKGMK